MFNLMEGCTCPQKSVYIILGLAYVAFYIGVVANLHDKNIRNKSMKKFIINIILILLVYKLLEILCDKKYNIIAWIIAFLPLVTFLMAGSILSLNIISLEYNK